jgi:hypothetical protein
MVAWPAGTHSGLAGGKGVAGGSASGLGSRGSWEGRKVVRFIWWTRSGFSGFFVPSTPYIIRHVQNIILSSVAK